MIEHYLEVVFDKYLKQSQKAKTRLERVSTYNKSETHPVMKHSHFDEGAIILVKTNIGVWCEQS